MEHINQEVIDYKLKFSQKIYRGVKALMDFLIALIALIILVPLFLIVAVAIKIDSKGPVFFVQKRIGKNGKLFNCIKFRTMSVEAKHDIAGYEYKEVNAYITKLGAKLRKFSIDELPQLYNILTFKMSLIGYRPSQACETELNMERERYNLYQIRPGISGWAQVNGRDVLAAQPKKKALFDAYYLQKISFWLDIKIFFMTIAKVFKSDNVEEGVLDAKSENEEAVSDVVISKTSETSILLNEIVNSEEKKDGKIA
ncbi:MAG: sugar transferase [Clostridia bacterium]|nr:sugar transferase [Clostridia bacterium]